MAEWIVSATHKVIRLTEEERSAVKTASLLTSLADKLVISHTRRTNSSQTDPDQESANGRQMSKS
jgi:hypothetical protein